MSTQTAVLFPWKDTYSVKIGIIDQQHKHLVKLINDLHHAMISGHGKEQLGSILSDLVKYTQVHFKTEESFMQTHHYPDFENHKAEHDKLTHTVLDLQGKFQRGEVGMTLEVMDFLKSWLKNHIMGSDQKYSPFLTEQGVH